MKQLLTLLLLGFAVWLHAQEKGLTPIQTASSSTQGSTYAVVVGISDYQDPGVPDLRFADKDAMAFAGFLQSTAGGAMDEDHLKVLINEQATAAQFAIALDWLWEVVGENDRVILYFSGHGDVERKSLTQPGYLLCWDAPSRVYLAGGAIALPMFQDVISTLSVQNKAKVLVITDACRSGKLSGSAVGGAQLTSSNLARQYANEIKILSCQPDEYSIEGEQWGGGRGAFSYHLLDGLYGLADGNADQSVNLMEIGRYLEDHVTTEVAPQKQNPMVIGDKADQLTTVHPEILAQLNEGRKGKLQLFTPTESRGIEDDVLAAADSNVVEMYRAFQHAIADRRFLEPAEACADFYYEKLNREPQLERLHSTMRRNYAAALQDDAQQVLNTILKSGLTGQILKNANARDLYKNHPAYLQRAAELLGKEHYMYPLLLARKYFFEGQVAESREDKRTFYQKALQLQPDMAHAMVEIIKHSEAEQLDSALSYFQRSTELIPSWVEPYAAMAHFYSFKTNQYGKAEEMLRLAGHVDSSSILIWYLKGQFYYFVLNEYQTAEKCYLNAIQGGGQDICFPCAYNNLGNVYQDTRRYAEAEQYLKKAIELDSTFTHAYSNLGNVYKVTGRYAEAERSYKKAIALDSTFTHAYSVFGHFYFDTRRYGEAEQYLKKAIELDSTNFYTLDYLGNVYKVTGRYAEAERSFKKALQLNPRFTNSYNHLGLLYIKARRFDEAKSSLANALELDPDNSSTPIYLAQWACKMKQPDKAWEHLEEGLKKGWDDYEDLQTEPNFEEMRKDPKWEALMKTYFPAESND